MTEINEFEREFVIRTRALLQDYNGEYKLSNAINCMLGLVILPNEMLEHSRDEIWDKPIIEIEELSDLHIQFFEPIRRKRREEIEYYQKTFRILLKKIRNGLAHQNITPVNADSLFTGVLIRNYFTEGNRDMDLEIKFDRRELEKFALFVAQKYLGD
jgi:hypothetical protein